MSQKIEIQPQHENELAICRILDIPREKAFQGWTTPELMKQWFCPKPWKVTEARLDLRAGGSTFVKMQGPDGTEVPCPGVYLEIVPNERIVFTDAYTSAWTPSEKPFMTAIVTFEDAGSGKTKYTARALHWRKEDRIEHEKMGFHEGWGICADQLEELMKKL